MKTKIYLFIKMFVLIAISSNLFNAQTFTPKPSGTTFILYDINIPPGQNTIAFAAGSQYTTGNSGIIKTSIDAGETWETLYPKTGTVPGFKKIKFVSNTRGFVVGQGSTFLKTIDGGSSWTNINVQNDIWYYSNLTFFDANIGFLTAVLNSGNAIAYRTADSGDTWTAISSVANLQTQAVTYATATTMYSTGNSQMISKSTDGGNTWAVVKPGTGTNLYFNLAFKDANNGVVSGEDGEVLKTTDGGTTWTQVLSTGYENLYGLFYSGNHIYASGTDQNIYYSSNNGGVFTPLNTASTSSSTLYGIARFANGEALLCGSQGTILKSTNFLLGTNDVIKNDIKLDYYYDNSIESLVITTSNEEKAPFALEIYAMDGKLVSKFESRKNKIVKNLSTFSKGVYIVKLKSAEGKSTTFKFIKN